MKKTNITQTVLLLFLGILVYHVYTLNPTSPLLVFMFLSGARLAWVAHKKNHWTGVIFMTLHMVIEAFEFASTKFVFGLVTGAIMLHVLGDIVLLRIEIQKHLFSVRKILFPAVLVVVGIVYLIAPSISSTSIVGSFMDRYRELIEIFALGGAIICFLSHIIPHKHHVEIDPRLKKTLK